MATTSSTKDIAGDQVGLPHDTEPTIEQVTTALPEILLADGETLDTNNPSNTTDSPDSTKKAKPSYTNTPPEMLEKIFSHLGASDLKSVRQVNKTSAKAASKWLYREVFCILLPESVAKLKNIASHPELKKHVQQVIYVGDALWHGNQNLAHWVEHALEEGETPTAQDLIKQQSITQLIADRELLLVEEEESGCLELVLASFQTLKTLAIMSAPELVQFSKYQIPRYNIVPILSQLSIASGLPLDVLFAVRNNDNDLSFPGFSMLKALANTQVELNRGRFSFIAEQFWKENPFRPTLFRDLKPALTSTLSKLTSMTYKLEYALHKDGNPNFRRASVTALLDILALTENLSYLGLTSETRRLHGEEFGLFEPMPFQMDISQLLSTARLPKLVSLNLEHPSATVADFLMFMKSHASTLLAINFKNLRLAHGDPCSDELDIGNEIGAWHHAFNEPTGIMNIETAICESLSDDWIRCEIKHWRDGGHPIRMQCYIEGWFKDQLFRLCYSTQKGWEDFEVIFKMPTMWWLSKNAAERGVVYKDMFHDFLMQENSNFDDVKVMTDFGQGMAFYDLSIMTSGNAADEEEAEEAYRALMRPSENDDSD